jgi:hypothetical protein
MPIKYTDGPYSYTTVVRDAHGCLHLFEGDVIPSIHPTLPKVSGKECPVFFQTQDDIQAILDCLPEDQRRDLQCGWTIITKHIPDDYFIQS